MPGYRSEEDALFDDLEAEEERLAAEEQAEMEAEDAPEDAPSPGPIPTIPKPFSPCSTSCTWKTRN